MAERRINNLRASFQRERARFYLVGSFFSSLLGKTNGLSSFANDVGGDSYLGGGANSFEDVSNIIDSGEDIAVQLEQSPGVIADEVANVASGETSGLAGTPFEQELQYIANDSSTWNRITWYMGDTVVGNPFAF